MKAIIWAAVSTKGQVAEGKGSIESQVALAQAVCDKNDWTVVNILEVPGHSRRYIDIYKLAEHAANEGIMAFKDLLDHFEKRDFDVLVVRDADRFARTQTLHAMITEIIVAELGAKIYSIADGMIDESNFRMWIAMAGYKAAGEVDSMMKKIKQGYDSRFERGLPVNANVCSSHKIVRDLQSGKALHIEVDETKRQEFADLATLILEGVSFKELEIEMYNRFGYARKKGGPHQPQRYYRMLRTPSFWGHHSRGHKQKPKGRWVYEERPDDEIPDGVEIIYNAFEPMYTGNLAERIKGEMTRRAEIMGRRRPSKSYKFSGLMICGICTHSFVYTGNKHGSDYTGLRCGSAYEKNPSTPKCNHRQYLNEKVAIQQIAEKLDLVLLEQDIRVLTHEKEPIDHTEQLATIDKEIQETEEQILVMINHQSKASESVQQSYVQQIQEAGSRLEILNNRRQDIRKEITATFTTMKRQKDAMIELARLGDELWSMKNNNINQLLGNLLGDYRFVVLNGSIIGIAIPPKHS